MEFPRSMQINCTFYMLGQALSLIVRTTDWLLDISLNEGVSVTLIVYGGSVPIITNRTDILLDRYLFERLKPSGGAGGNI